MKRPFRSIMPVKNLKVLLCFCTFAICGWQTVLTDYTKISGLQCVRPQFLQAHDRARSDLECATLCDRTTDCQAFSVADGPCQLFVFNRCSKFVRDCSCTRIKQVFVKQQPGLSSGALCPAGFADDLCGTKYKLYSGIQDWNVAKTTMDAQPGLTIMAEITNLTESDHLTSVMTRNLWTTVIIGGKQLPGSVEPSGGWFWATCNSAIDSSLWSTGQPDNAGGNENFAVLWTTKMNDVVAVSSSFIGALAECVSPFA